MREQPLCALAELADPGSRGFAVEQADGTVLQLFVVRRGTAVYAYRNRCPHTGAPLEWQPDQFLDYEGSFIQCALHGALFDMADGRCLRGPCSGDHLQPLTVTLRDGWVLLRLDD